MARYRGPLCRLCRREHIKLFLKGERCMTDKCALARRAYSPGQHGKARSKLSDYALQLREKQKVRRIYGIGEHQFRIYFRKAAKAKGITGTALLQSLERRLDNVAFSLGFAVSRNQAKQLVKHKFFLINSKPVNIPSYWVKPNDAISVRNDEKKIKLIRQILKLTKERVHPEWLHLDNENLKGTVVRLPKREEIKLPIQEQLIVELYSK